MRSSFGTVAELALHVEGAVRESGGAIRGEAGARRSQHLDLLEGAQVKGFLFADQLGDAITDELVRPARSHVHAPNHPFRVADEDAHAGSGHGNRG